MEDDEHLHGATVDFEIEGVQYDARHEISAEDITSKWIEAELGFWDDNKITFEQLLNNNAKEEKKIIPENYPRWDYYYKVYAQIISINPFILDCGELVLTGSTLHRSSIKMLNSPEYIGRFIYFETIRLSIRNYRLIEKPIPQSHNSSDVMIKTVRVWAKVNSTGIVDEQGNSFYKETTDITDNTWRELQEWVAEYKVYRDKVETAPNFYPDGLHNFIEKVKELDRRGIEILKKTRNEWQHDKSTQTNLNFIYRSELTGHEYYEIDDL